MKKALSLKMLPLLLLAVSQGCDCGRGPSTSASEAGLGVVWLDADGKTLVNRDATYDFGNARRGERVPKKLVIRNLGTGPLTLLNIERLEGDAVSLGTDVQPQAAFEIRFTPNTTVSALEEIQLDMFFTPPASKDPFGAVSTNGVKLKLVTAGPPDEESTALLTLKGNSEPGACALPKELDFGKVLLGETASLVHIFNNFSTGPSPASVGNITGADAAAFRLASGDPGDYLVEEGQAVSMRFEFSPKEMRTYEASVTLRAPGADCPTGTVLLKGEAVSELLTWSPTSLDFGYTSPGTVSPKQIIFVNVSKDPITLTQVGTSMPSDFAMKPAAGTDPTTFVVPGNGVPTPMDVICKPTSLGPRGATLSFRTPITRQPSGAIALTCFGGGPDIEVSPASALPFGQVGFFSGVNPQPSVSRRLTVLNVGTKPPNGDANGNLKLGSVGPSGAGIPPLVSIVPLNGTTAANEFSVGLPPNYNAATGLEATAGKNVMDLTIILTPQFVGTKEAELTIFSNDPDEPAVKIRLSADAVDLPPCRFAVSPAQLNFGLITPPSYKDLPVTFTNLGTAPNEVCLISGVDLAAGSSQAFSVVGGAIASQSVKPGESTTVVVRADPGGVVPSNVVSLSGFLQFNISSPTTPQYLVKLVGQVGAACLTVAPDAIDFGTVRQGCKSSTRTFTLYNTCSQTVTLKGFSVPSPAGQPAGGPNCPGTAACPEFTLVSTPSLPASGLPVFPGSTPLTFQARYRPIDMNSDVGAIAVEAIQNGQNVSYLVTVKGKGDAVGLQTDTFEQDAKPKADVLLTVDNSCSMDDKQTSLANNFSSFMAYANSAQVDYHLGVTTTDDFYNYSLPPIMSAATEGRLVGDDKNPKVLTSGTPDVEAKFRDKVKVGIQGSADEKGLATSMKAVTPPLVTGDNAGFLRPEANLAIVVITDALDQSTQPVSYYYNRLMNVKGFSRANMFTFNVIGPFSSNPPSNCAYDSGSPDDGRWAQMISATSGFKEEICNPNWSVKMQDLGKTAFGFRTTFYLNSLPDLTGGKTIDVRINGSPVAATNFTYDSVANAVVFNPMFTPDPGDNLSISYTVACL